MKKENTKPSFWHDESGDFGIKQIAITVAVIIVIGLILTIVNQNISTWVSEIWDLFMDRIENLTT